MERNLQGEEDEKVPKLWWTRLLCSARKSNDLGAKSSSRKRRDRRRGWRMESGDVDKSGPPGLGDLEGVINGDVYPRPEHLVVLVNGIVGGPENWIFAAERFRSKLGRSTAIHCSANNSSMKTFDGVDVMGKRLAEEVREIIDKTPGVKRISFVAHSLGGLISRYAIAQLYCPPVHGKFGEGVMDPNVNSKITSEAAQSEFTIGGLQPENFITLATPHLGCRGAEQLPFLLGVQAFEKTASALAHWFVGTTGKHLFLTDGNSSSPPLLRKMVTDCKEGQFISSLQVFKKRVAYANVMNDRMVGWRTASIRRPSEMPEIKDKPIDPLYPHVFREEEPVLPAVEDLSVVNFRPSVNVTSKVGEDVIEEEIVRGLTQLPWYRVDVSFQSYQAHNLIQVKTPKVHSAGGDVIEHIIDKHFAVESQAK